MTDPAETDTIRTSRGPRSLDWVVEWITDYCWNTRFGYTKERLTAFDPLVQFLTLVSRAMYRLDVPIDSAVGKHAWISAVQAIQQRSGDLDYNPWLPCRYCD